MSFQYPEFFKLSCKMFFGCHLDKPNDVIDPHWKVDLNTIYKGLFDAFENNWNLYLPDIKLPLNEVSFLNYAQSIRKNNFTFNDQINEVKSSVKDSKSINKLKLGIVGKIGQGKSTMADYLCKEKGFIEYAFAGPLKRGVGVLFDFTYEQLYTEEKEKIDPRWGVSPRVILQQIGLDLFRNNILKHIQGLNIFKSFWIDHFYRWFDQCKNQNVVVSDCRFPDEFESLKDCGFMIYKIIRPNFNIFYFHSSEILQDNISSDETIYNDGTLEKFYENINSFL